MKPLCGWTSPIQFKAITLPLLDLPTLCVVRAGLGMTMARSPNNLQTIKHERSREFRTAVVDGATTNTYTDPFISRIALAFTRIDRRVVSERVHVAADGQITFPKDQPLATELVKIVEFEAILGPHQALELIKAISSNLRQLPQERKVQLGMEDIIIGLEQLFSL